jgi:predicted dehydrogenase
MREVAAAGANIVALCDVNEVNLDAAQKLHPRARRFKDYRKLYGAMKSFDAVVVSTTEHTHAFAVLPALLRRKHVYCEKPLSHSVWEARVLRKAARESGVATQMGTQIHAGANYRRVVELVRGGAIGRVRECHVWVSRAWGLQSREAATRNKDKVYVTARPAPAAPPKTLDWNLWLGPAPRRPYNEVYIPGSKWYRWWDFGNGTMSDLGSHWNDLPFWALDLRAPETIEAREMNGLPADPEIAPASMTVAYEFGARGAAPPVRLVWYQGEPKPPHWAENMIPRWDAGVLFVGASGMLLADYGKHLLLPEGDFRDFRRPDPSIPDSVGHHREWVEACKSGAPTTCNFEYSGNLTESNHLGNVAYRVGKKLVWDPVRLEVTNAPEAARFIRRDYRKGWRLA